ncbi:Aldose reductase [Gryllus bimaculatus]|nr:Aldose reductase [Gryllus bimaculatus]
MSLNVPFVKLNNGQQFPIFGLGTWKSKPGEVTQAVKDAIDAGYRHIDCAHVYGNEAEVGAGIKAKIDEGVVKREHLYITSKEGESLFPEKDGKTLYSDVDYVDTWKAMEQLVKKGLTKSIGVSNFNHKQINRVLEVAEIKPVTNQVEVHPYLNQEKLINFCKSKDIVVTAYSPLASPDRPWAKPDDPQLLEDPKLKNLAVKYGKTPAQILLRYGVQRNLITIPKSVTKSRIVQNIDIFDFDISEEDMKLISSFDCNGRVVHVNWFADHKYYPFHLDF